MSDVMLFGILRMPFDLAMSDEISRHQYWQRGQQAVNEIEKLRAEVEQLRAERRERIASAAMSGLLADTDRMGTYVAIAKDAVACADALIAELHKDGGR